RLPAVVSLDPRDAEPAALVVAPRLLSRVLREPVRLAARAVAERAPQCGAAHDLRRDDHLLSVLRGVLVLPGGGAALRVRPRAQRGDGRVAGARDAVVARPRRLVGRRVSVVARRGRGRGRGVPAAVLAWPLRG